MTINLSAAELTHVVTAVPGVRGIEPGIGSTLKAIGSRMSGDPAAARFGVIIESGGQKVIIEIGIDGSRAVKEIVRDVQGEGASTVPYLTMHIAEPSPFQGHTYH